jgi:hypothetical protein
MEIIPLGKYLFQPKCDKHKSLVEIIWRKGQAIFSYKGMISVCDLDPAFRWFGPLSGRKMESYGEWRITKHGKEVFAQALDIALQMRRKGFQHYSIWMIANVIRHHRHLTHGPDDGFKLNNNRLAYLARELMDDDARLAGFFETRELKE